MHFFFFFILSFYTTQALSFVLIDGNNKVKLKSTHEAPEVEFFWNKQTVKLKNIESFEDGILVGLSEEDQTKTILEFAMKAWNDVPGSYLKMKLTVDETKKIDKDDKYHVISVGKNEVFSAAFALPVFKDKEIEDCDVTIAPRSTSAKIFAATLIHELGHCAGLGHEHTNYAAIMGYARNDNNPTLGLDDMAGLIYLYPEEKISATTEPKCGLTTKNIPPQNWWGYLLMMLCPLVALKKRKKLSTPVYSNTSF